MCHHHHVFLEKRDETSVNQVFKCISDFMVTAEANLCATRKWRKDHPLQELLFKKMFFFLLMKTKYMKQMEPFYMILLD